MFISKADFKIKAEKYDETLTFAQALIPELRTIKGTKQFIVIRTGNDTSSTIVSYDSKEDAEAAAPHVQQIFSRMVEFVTAPPERNVYEAVIYEQF